MAYFYTKLAIHSSLRTAVNVCIFFMAGMLVLIWHLLSYQWEWMLYFFNAFVSLFSITLVSQGWLVAANIFTTREAKRLYGILGVGRCDRRGVRRLIHGAYGPVHRHPKPVARQRGARDPGVVRVPCGDRSRRDRR